MRKLLYLVHRVPYPPDKGDRIRNYHLLKYLARYAAVHVACLADEPVSRETIEALSAVCDRLEVVPLGRRMRRLGAIGSLLRGHTATEGAFASPELSATVRDWARQVRFDFALASASSMVPYLRLPELRTVPAVIDLVDVDSQKWLDYAEAGSGPRSWLHRLEGSRLRRLEQALPSWAHAVTLVSEAEARLYREFCAPGLVQGVPNGVDLDYYRPREEIQSPACVFVGAMDYRPNIDAALWFSREVWPGVRSANPEAEFWIVGRQPVPAVRRLADIPGIRVVGQVPDVRPYLSWAAVAVVPLRLARGLQNKVLEALAMSRAVVASPQALAAINVRSGEHLLSATTPAEWVQAIVGLLGDENRRRHLGAMGRHYVERHHDWERCLAPFAALLGLESEELPAPAVPEETYSA